MDANKMTKLKEVGYHIPETCGICAHSSFNSSGEEWGDCSKHGYDHLKHSDNPRKLSIFRGGVCNQFVSDPIAMQRLGHFKEFLK